MRLKGSCIIYTAIKKVRWEDEEYELAANDGDYYISEPIETTRTRLSNGLLTLGLKCLDISIKLFDKYTNGNSCVEFECECDDDINVSTEMYIQGLKTYEWQDAENSLLEMHYKL